MIGFTTCGTAHESTVEMAKFAGFTVVRETATLRPPESTAIRVLLAKTLTRAVTKTAPSVTTIDVGTSLALTKIELSV